MTILFFIIALGVLVFVHEFGHFLLAKLQGIGVEKFSLGFGPKILGFKRKDTEYLVSALPLGGYVKLHGEDPAEGDPEDPTSFSTRPIWHRLKVVVAGPFMNLLLALFLLPVVFMVGRQEPVYFQEKPLLVGVVKGSAAEEGGLEKGDLIRRIDGKEFQTWKGVLDDLILEGEGVLTFQVERNGHLLTKEVSVKKEGKDEGTTVGIEPHLLIGNEAIVDEVMKGSSAEGAGLQVGDKVLRIDGEKVAGWSEMSERVNASQGRTLSLTVERGRGTLLISVTPKKGETGDRWLLGIKKDYEKHGPSLTVRQYPFFQAVAEGTKENLKLARLTFEVLGRLVTGRLSYKTLGGPIRIAQASATAARAGFSHFLYFLGFLSIQLGLLNLLPIPVLDGGHLLFYTIEGVIRRPLSLKVRGWMEQGGFVLLVGLMILITFNDVDRVWGFRSIYDKIRHLF